MDDSNVATRLKHFMETEGLSISQFADQCGIPRPSLSQLLSGRNKKLSDVVVKQIHVRFPDLSVVWLMFGEGEMMLPKPINPALASEAAKFMDIDADENANQNLSELTLPNSTLNQAENQLNKRSNDSSQICVNLDKKQLKPRKVMSITIFYDDNSYETFVPEKK